MNRPFTVAFFFVEPVSRLTSPARTEARAPRIIISARILDMRTLPSRKTCPAENAHRNLRMHQHLMVMRLQDGDASPKSRLPCLPPSLAVLLFSVSSGGFARGAPHEGSGV